MLMNKGNSVKLKIGVYIEKSLF